MAKSCSASGRLSKPEREKFSAPTGSVRRALVMAAWVVLMHRLLLSSEPPLQSAMKLGLGGQMSWLGLCGGTIPVNGVALFRA